MVGRLAEKPPAAGRQVAGLLVRARGRDALLAAGDLPTYTKLHPGRVLQRQAIPLTRPFSEASDSDCGLNLEFRVWVWVWACC